MKSSVIKDENFSDFRIVQSFTYFSVGMFLIARSFLGDIIFLILQVFWFFSLITQDFTKQTFSSLKFVVNWHLNATVPFKVISRWKKLFISHYTLRIVVYFLSSINNLGRKFKTSTWMLLHIFWIIIAFFLWHGRDCSCHKTQVSVHNVGIFRGENHTSEWWDRVYFPLARTRMKGKYE